MEVNAQNDSSQLACMPIGWKLSTIGENAEILGRIGFRGYTVNDIVSEGQGAIALNPSNIKDGKVNFDKCTYLSWCKYEESPEIKIEIGDVVLVKTGSTFGKSATITYLPEKTTLNPQVIVFKKIKIDPVFFGYLVGFETVQKQITEFVVGGVLPTLSQNLISKFIIPIPSKNEQLSIASALSDVDALIAGLEKLIAKKRDLKQAAMQQLLTGQTRLPGFSGEWTVKRLGEVASLKNGYMFRSDTYLSTGNYKVITIANVQDGYMAAEFCNLVGAPPKDIQPHQELKIGDILISMTGNVGRVCRVSEDNCLLNQRVGKLLPTAIDGDFLFAVLCYPSFTQSMIGTAKGGAQPNLSATDINEYEFRMPMDIDEQLAIAKAITDIDSYLSALEFRKAKVHEIKQGMMQDLLTGRTRLV